MLKNCLLKGLQDPMKSSDIKIELFTKSNIPEIVSSFNAHHWLKPATTFETYWKEQQNNERLMWLAYYQNEFAGYITLKFQSYYKPFLDENIPEIMDLNVLPSFRNKGIGTSLLKLAENIAFKESDIVGIGVGLYKDYGPAQQLYIKNAYIPNGLGVTYNYLPITPGSKVDLDDDLVLWFTKKNLFLI